MPFCRYFDFGPAGATLALGPTELQADTSVQLQAASGCQVCYHSNREQIHPPPGVGGASLNPRAPKTRSDDHQTGLSLRPVPRGPATGPPPSSLVSVSACGPCHRNSSPSASATYKVTQGKEPRRSPKPMDLMIAKVSPAAVIRDPESIFLFRSRPKSRVRRPENT